MRKNISKKVVVIGVLVLLLGAGVALGSNATRDSKPAPIGRGPWFENFDSYQTGSALHGQGGWFAWDGLTVNTGYVVDTQSLSPSNSLEVKWTTTTDWVDMVHTFTNVNSGNWTIRAWLYVPSTMTGNSYFILMNTYINGSHTNNNNWSLELEFSASGGTIYDRDATAYSLPLIKDAWAQIRVEINFEADTQTIYYGGQLLESTNWRNHCAAGGAKNLACVDLYADSAYSTAVYWDELSVVPPAEPLSCDAGGPYNGQVNEAIHFSGTAEGGWEPYAWFWNFGDGSNSTEQNPTHVFTTVGTYNVTLTVTDAIRDNVTDTATVTIVQPTEPVLQITSITGGFGISAVISNTGTAPATNVQWTINCTGFVFPKAKSGSVTSLAVGSTATATKKVLGLGSIAITVSATCAEGKTAQKTATAKVFLFFVLGVT
jgi:hypothetical protein